MSLQSLDVLIGTVYVFLLFSLVVTAAVEAISALLKLRGRALEMAVRRLIDDPDAPWTQGGFGFTQWMVSGSPDPEKSKDKTRVKFVSLWSHPLLASSRRLWFFNIERPPLPSYIAPSHFASALLAQLKALDAKGIASSIATLPEGRLRQTLQACFDEAEGDMKRLRANIERWFDDAMQRLTGEFKRYTQLVSFVIGLVLALAFHVDAIAVVRELSSNPELAARVAEMAEAKTAHASAASGSEATRLCASDNAAAPTEDAAAQSAAKDIEAACRKLVEARAALDNLVQSSSSPLQRAMAPKDFDASVLLGCVLTAIAGTLGAPFWFDALQKLINLRGAGPKPKSSAG